jgi:signal transduction histidine kinase
MNERDRISLVQSVARLAAAESRPASLNEVSAHLGIECVLFFLSDPARGVMRLAPGFSLLVAEPRSWETFLAACVERGRHVAELSVAKPGESKTVTGIAWQNKAVLALVGPKPGDDVLGELLLLLPLLASALRHEESSTEQSAKDIGEELSRANLELARVREQAVAATITKDDFLAALSHELRTPLNPVLLIASEAAENPAFAAAVREDFASIAKNAEVEARLIDDLMDITRITQGKMSLDKRGFDLRFVLEDAIATVRARVDTKKIDFIATLDARAHPVFGDSARLQQVFWNVLKTGVKFMPAGGNIRIETRLEESANQIVIIFTDAGTGMTPAELEYLSDSVSPVAPVNPVMSPFFGRLGLGMTISHLLVHLHAGTMEAESAGRGKGTVFTIKLPLSRSSSSGKFPPALTPLETAPKPPEADRHPRVLLVEDHEPTSVVLARLMKRRNFDVIVAATMAEALQAAEAHRFDLVVSDIGLPDGDGYSLMTVLGERYQLRGIAVTGYGMQGDIARSEAAGFIAHVTKPVNVRALEAALELVFPR